MRDDPFPCSQSSTGLSSDLVDNDRTHRWNDSAFDGDGKDRGRGQDGYGTHQYRRSERSVRSAFGLFALTVVMGQLISNTATALIIIPVAISAAAETHVSVRPLLMAVTVAAAASFLTPIATPANMMVMEPGGYRFGDYWKFGLTLVFWYLVVTVVIIPLIWRF